MTNNTTDTVRALAAAINAAQGRNATAPALTDEQIRSLNYVIERLEIASVAPECEHANNLRALLTSPRAAVPAPEGWKLVPIERSYDMRVKALLAFNTTEKETNDRDDALDAAHRAMLDAAPAAPVAEPASQGVITAALAVIECDRAQVLTDAHIDALDNAIKIQRGDAELPVAAQAVAADGAALAEDRIDWIANAHCPGGTAYPVNVKNAIREALREARAAVSPATAEPTDYAAIEREHFGDPDKRTGIYAPATADERHEDGLLTTEALISIIERHFDHDHPDGQRLVEMAQDVAASQHKQGEPATADELAAFLVWWTRDVPEELRRDWINRNEQFLREGKACEALARAWEGWQARASQAAAPAEAIDRYQAVCAAAYQLAGVVGAPLRFLDALSDAANGEPMSADEALNLLPEGLNEIDEVNRSASAPAEAREPVGRFDKSLNQIRWRDGLVNADFADRQPFYTYPVGATAEAREPNQVYVECRQCESCDHIGINDSHEADAACNSCGWNGPSPAEDKCPGCGDENCMAVACPKCSGRYALLAEGRFLADEIGVPADAGEAVAQWQTRVRAAKTAAWVNVTEEDAKHVMSELPEAYEVRALYERPAPADARGAVDAARYRIVRSGVPLTVDLGEGKKRVIYYIGAKLEAGFGEALDSAIDAILDRGVQGGKGGEA
ncbi:hypothetical protein ACVCII_24185 [Burkholderia glumae]|uniref:hypothetical protein n=1 Tax=Burkholderia glumae TaxID=337 RepID=UPI002037206F|nr:hypothetical protein [Burkholderia glumae]MCM2543874.1 hypothetical protein [Burkholderia glumae]